MPRYLVKLTQTQEMTVTVIADTAIQAEVEALEECYGLDWPAGRIRVQSCRNISPESEIRANVVE